VTEEQGASGVLDQVRRTAVELVSAAATTPRRITVRSGDVAVEVEWPETAGIAPGPGARPAEPSAADDCTGLDYIRASIIGTFYGAPTPGAAPFVSVGDAVEPGQQVAILESMKLMTAVEAEQHGIVTEILVLDGHPVEYGTPLIALAATQAQA
jgi:acetyl-CoA carboxylase biotin carboxyl carrier protein